MHQNQLKIRRRKRKLARNCGNIGAYLFIIRDIENYFQSIYDITYEHLEMIS